MRPPIQRLTAEQFSNSPATTLFNPPYSRCFGLINYGRQAFKFSWHSELVDPELLSDDKALCGVGIDQCYALFDMNTGEVIKRIDLTSFFVRAILVNDDIFIFCQTEALRYRIPDFETVRVYGFPDVFESVDGEEDRLTVECMDGSEVVILL